MSCQGADKSEVWIDPDAHLLWTPSDNGSGLSWIQAQRYCRGLTLGGCRNWTLPPSTIFKGWSARELDARETRW
jgi:hypothetical protein